MLDEHVFALFVVVQHVMPSSIKIRCQLTFARMRISDILVNGFLYYSASRLLVTTESLTRERPRHMIVVLMLLRTTYRKVVIILLIFDVLEALWMSLVFLCFCTAHNYRNIAKGQIYRYAFVD